MAYEPKPIKIADKKSLAYAFLVDWEGLLI
jgi:hypothetical protein